MSARLQYAKVVDSDHFYARGGKVHPGLENFVVVRKEPGEAGAFLVLRGWHRDHGTFTEQWRIEGPGGLVLHEGVPREVHLPTDSHIERLEDEITDLEIDPASGGYAVVFLLDDEPVARVGFAVKVLQGDEEPG